MRREMRHLVMLVLAAGLVAAPAAHAENIVAGPNSTYLTTSPSMDQGEELTFYSFDVPNHDVTAREKGPDGKPLFKTDLIGAGDTAFVEGSQYLTTGSYEFFCSIHANMVGTLTVTSGGAPKPRPGAGDPPDTKKPEVKLKVLSAGAASVRRSRKLQVEVSVDEGAAVSLKAVTRRSGRRVTIATGNVELSSAGTRRETLAVTRAGRKALSGRSRKPVTVTARAVDRAGNAGTATAGRTLR